MTHRKTALSALLLITPFLLFSDAWPQLRGPNRDGISHEAGSLIKWGDNGPSLVWSKSLGIGSSGAAIADGRLFTLGYKNKIETVYCLDPKSGNEIWKHSYPSELEDKYWSGGSRGTPTIDGNTVYVMGHMGELIALNAADGKIKWQKHIVKDYRYKRPVWGYAASPLIDGDMLIFLTGKDASLLALDKHTGRTIWEQSGYSSSYCSPLADTNYPGNAFVFTETGMLYFRIKDGAKLWEYPWKTSYDLNITTPQIVGKDLFITSGYKHGAALLSYDEKSVSKKWMTPDFANQFSGVILSDSYIYGCHGNDNKSDTYLACLDPKNGSIKWKMNGSGCGSVLKAYGKLIAFTEKGELILAELNPNKYVEIDRMQILSGQSFSPPSLSDGLIYCRNNKGKMVCYQIAE